VPGDRLPWGRDSLGAKAEHHERRLFGPLPRDGFEPRQERLIRARLHLYLYEYPPAAFERKEQIGHACLRETGLDFDDCRFFVREPPAKVMSAVIMRWPRFRK
jgi:hypothetical protein